MKKTYTCLVFTLALCISACGRVGEAALSAPEEGPAPAPVLEPTHTPVPPAREATIEIIANQALARSTSSQAFEPAQAGMVLQVGGGLETFDDSRASLNLNPEGTLIRVGPNTIFTVSAPVETSQSHTRLHLDIGQIWILLKGGSLEVVTPSGLASVRGSLLGVSYVPGTGRMQASCLEGECRLENELGSVELTDGQFSYIEGDLGPSEIEFMDELDLQEWVNENPDAWQYFDKDDMPAWLPDPDLRWLAESGSYFDWYFEQTNIDPEEFLEDGELDDSLLDDAMGDYEIPDSPPDVDDLPDGLP